MSSQIRLCEIRFPCSISAGMVPVASTCGAGPCARAMRRQLLGQDRRLGRAQAWRREEVAQDRGSLFGREGQNRERVRNRKRAEEILEGRRVPLAQLHVPADDRLLLLGRQSRGVALDDHRPAAQRELELAQRFLLGPHGLRVLGHDPPELTATALADARQVEGHEHGRRDPGDDDRIAQRDDQPGEGARNQPDRRAATGGGCRLLFIPDAQVASLLGSQVTWVEGSGSR